VLSTAIAATATFWLETIYHPRLVRMFAYVADYESAYAYPGVESARFRLHDNAVVSYATYHAGDVMIRVAHVQSPPSSPT